MRILWPVLCLISLTGSSVADVSDEVVHCGAIENDVARLECFDELTAIVRQAAREDLPIDELLGDVRCPIRLEIDISRSEIGRVEGWQEELGEEFQCEAVTLETLWLGAKRKGQQIELGIEAAIWVVPSHDRSVDLRLVFLGPEGVVFEEKFRDIDAEEDTLTRARSTRILAPDIWGSVFDKGNGRLRLEMTAIRD